MIAKRTNPLWILAGMAALSCGGPETMDSQTPSPVQQGDAPATAANAEARSNKPPSMEIPAWDKVGVGQEIGFGLEVIDEDQNDVRVELVSAPKSVKFDPLTLTVVWTPTAADKPMGFFDVKLIEKTATGDKIYRHGFAIEVTDQKQPKPTAQPLSPSVEQLITIHDSERLAEVNQRWPIDVLLARAGASVAEEHSKSHPDEKIPTTIDGKALFNELLGSMAKANHNPRIDPKSPSFDAKSFGDPKTWKLIAVRPRIDKKWHEVRLVYKAEAAHEATYVMFKWRPTFFAPPPQARDYNNKTFSKLVFDHFFTKDGELNPAHTKDKKAHGKKVAEFVTAVVTYQDNSQPWARGTFLGLPAEARLGGGSKRDDSGNYESGDAWGWNVMKIKVKDGKTHLKNVPIKGFATDVAAKDGAWALACGPAFQKPPLDALCRDSGHTDMPATGDGYHEAAPGQAVVSSKVDAANLFVDYKARWMTENVPLRDPRRDLFEEKGMTCSQCHVRKFGVRDMYDRTAYDSTAGVPTVMNKSQAATYFVITPTVSWQPYAIDFQHKQECKFKVNMEKELGRTVKLGCPLKSE